MPMKIHKILCLLVVLITTTVHYGQETETEETLSLDKGAISSQFDYISEKSGNYRANDIRYEVVKEDNLFKLRKNVLDSIAAISKKIGQLKGTISEHETTITSLNNKLQETSASLSEVSEEKDNMNLLGVPVSKGAYKITLWIVIALLTLLLGLFIYKFRNSNVLTHEAKQNLADLEVEYEDHRRRALEREQKISRQLQDERNKQKNSK